MKKFCLFIFLLILSNPAYADITTGLVAWWRFGEATTGTCTAAQIMDSSGKGNTGTCNGSPTWGVGQIGRGDMVMTGVANQYVDFGDFAGLANATSASWSFWIKFTTLAVTRIMTQWSGTAANAAWIIQTYNTGKNILFALYNGNYYQLYSTTTNFTTGTWYHVVITWTTPQTTHIYISTVAQNITTQDANNIANIISTTTHAQLGYETAEGIDGFAGSIDDIRIYNRVLNTTDIAQLYAYRGQSAMFFNVPQKQ